MPDEERRRGMMEIAEVIGGLKATVEANARRSEDMHRENITWRNDLQTTIVARIADVQAQVHEIKHAQANTDMKFARLEQIQLAQHEVLTQHQKFAAEGLGSLRTEILQSRDASAARFDDLFAWRNKLRGAKALLFTLGSIIALGLASFGHEIFHYWKNLTHR